MFIGKRIFLTVYDVGLEFLYPIHTQSEHFEFAQI